MPKWSVAQRRNSSSRRSERDKGKLPSAVNCAILPSLTAASAIHSTPITLIALCALPLMAAAQEGITLKQQRSLLTIPAVRDEPSPLFMEADRLFGHAEKETEAEGNVRLRRLNQLFSADRMRYDASREQLD